MGIPVISQPRLPGAEKTLDAMNRLAVINEAMEEE
jgi:hypothetical protein